MNIRRLIHELRVIAHGLVDNKTCYEPLHKYEQEQNFIDPDVTE